MCAYACMLYGVYVHLCCGYYGSIHGGFPPYLTTVTISHQIPMRPSELMKGWEVEHCVHFCVKVTHWHS